MDDSSVDLFADDSSAGIVDDSSANISAFKEILNKCNVACMKDMMVILQNSLDSKKTKRSSHPQKH